MAQLGLFEIATPPHSHDVAITPEIDQALADHAPVAIGVSGGKDSSAVAIRTFEYLDDCGHRGPRLLIHCDLGEIEWAESLPMCERLAASLGTELLVLRRAPAACWPAGGSAGKATNNGTPGWNAFASLCPGVRLPLGSVRAS
jgi:3'-phosphoadenosine 5'-phosphosulfate sulfotransferase (PAPS reductase)/FAD synthetase